MSPITLKAKSAQLRRTMIVPCGKCVPCLEKKRADWSLRLQEQLNYSSTARFLTLTYNDENLPFSEVLGIPELNKDHLKGFIKQLRNYLRQGIQTTNQFGKSVKSPKTNVKLKYFAQGEYGSKKDRPHYHMILFNFPDFLEYLIELAWHYGNVHFGDCNNATIHYTTKYLITKHDEYFEDLKKPFALMSKGLGGTYIDRNKKYHETTMSNVVTKAGGVKYPLPRYFKEKIFDETQKMQISAKSLSYAQRQQEVKDQKLQKLVKDSSEFFSVKQKRINDYAEARLKFLNKSNKL